MVDRAYKEDLPAFRKVLEKLKEDFSNLSPKTNWTRLRIEPLLKHLESMERILGSPESSGEFSNLTLDGVMQAPGRPDEDTRGGFKHGGWGAPYAAMTSAGEVMANVGSVLFGRRTYEDFYSVWPKRTESPFSKFFDNIPKYVAST